MKKNNMVSEPQQSADKTASSRATGRSQSGLREYNQREILSLIRVEGALPKAEIAQKTGLSAQAATVIINSLEADSLLTRLPSLKGQIGQPKVPFALNPDGAFGIGLKVGRRSFDLTLIDFVGNVRATLNENFAYPTVERLLNFLSRGLKGLTLSLDASMMQRIQGIGVATPYQIWSWAEEAGAPSDELEKWKNFDFHTRIKSIIDLPVYVCNDGTAACSAELCFGNSHRLNHFLYVYVGTFIGGGVVLNNRLFTGKSGNAGAIGSLPMLNSGNGSGQLIMQSSLYLLEQKLQQRNLDPNMLYNNADFTGQVAELLPEWIDGVSQGIAHSALCSLSILDLDGVVIDGAIPGSVRERIVAASREKFAELDARGLTSLRFEPGNVGAKAQSIGSANLPLIARYYQEAQNVFQS